VILVVTASAVSIAANGASVGVAEVAVADAIDWIDDALCVLVAAIVDVVDVPFSNSTVVLPVEAKIVDNGSAGVIFVVVVIVVVVSATGVEVFRASCFCVEDCCSGGGAATAAAEYTDNCFVFALDGNF